MSKVTAINAAAITPDLVLEALRQAYERGDFNEIYVVTVKDDKIQDTEVYASGDLRNMAFAALALEDYCVRLMNGEIDE